MSRALDPVSELLTTDEVIDRLLANANLRRLAATCVLPAVRCGDSWRFRRTDLDEWIARQLPARTGEAN